MRRLAKFVEGCALVASLLLGIPIGVHIVAGIVMNGPTAIETAIFRASVVIYFVVSITRGYFERNQK